MRFHKLFAKFFTAASLAVFFTGGFFQHAFAANLSAPLFIKSGYGLGARFNYSSESSREGRAGMAIRFIYDGDTSGLAGFRLYEMRPNDTSYTRVAEFTNLLSVGGATYNISGNWSLGRVSGTTSWMITRIIPGNPAGVPYYAPQSAWPIGTYHYYLTAIDSYGTEGQASQIANVHMLEPLSVLYPTASQSPAQLVPTFRWTVPSGMPANSNYGFGIRLYEGTKEVWVGLNPESPGTKKYDGTALTEGKLYTIHIHLDLGSYTQYPLDTYFALPANVETFSVSATPPPAPAVTPPPSPPPTAPIACTQDVKACPDGSYVGRVAPTCEFRACPVAPPPSPPPSPTQTPAPKPISHTPSKIIPAKPKIPEPQKTKEQTPALATSTAAQQNNIAISNPEIIPEQPSVPRPQGFFARFRLTLNRFFKILFGR